MKYLKLLFLVVACGALTQKARAQISPNPTNTLVRFTIIRGLNLLGTMDFELFDQDKPETVRNFLTYVLGGHYQNLVLQRCAPEFVLQAGEVRVTNPRSTQLFAQYLQVLNLGSITNEYSVGATQSNVYGTIAMAKVAGQTNSASTDWFINLTNNNVTTTNSVSLDEQDGGYTVFGRILPSTNVVAGTNVLSGTNVLEHFNSLNFNSGLLNLPIFCLLGIPAFCRPEAQLFNTLPAVGTGLFIPRYADLYYVQIKVLSPRETVRPAIVLKSPTLNQRVTNETHLATGTAADDRGLAVVYYQLNDGPKLPASGLTNWSATLPLRAGTNRLAVHCVDMAGNPSPVIQRLFYRVDIEALVLQTNGAGKTSGLTNGQRLEIGRGYKITATPAPGHLFKDWTGSITSSAPVLSFLMESNMALQANFIPNPFIPLKGVYNGLFYPTNEIAPERSGFFSTTITDLGRFTARLQLGAHTIPLSGQLNLEGQAGLYIFLAGNPVYFISLQLDLTNGTQQITGTFTDSIGTAPMLADRATFQAVTNKATNFVGKYTLSIPGPEEAAVQPSGNGFGTVTIDLAGNVLFSGTLADGTPATQRVPLSRDGRWPLFASSYAGKSLILGWITCTNRETDDLNGSVTWTKSPLAVKYYPLGFTNMTNIVGSRYLPMGTNRVLAVTNALISFSGGNLMAAFTNEFTLTPPTKVTVVPTNSNRLALTVTTASGLFTGTVTPPGTLKAVPFKGALLQKQRGGGGLFLGTNQSSRVTITPE